MSSFFLHKSSQLEHKLESLLHHTILLLSLQLKQTGSYRIKLFRLVECLALLDSFLDNLDFAVQLLKSFLHIQLLKCYFKLYSRLCFVKHIYGFELFSQHFLGLFSLVLVSDNAAR